MSLSHLLEIKQERSLDWEERFLLASAFLYILGVVALNTVLIVSFALFCALMYSYFAGISMKHLFARLMVISPFLLLMTAPLLFGGGLPLDVERIEMTLLILLKALTSISIMVILTTHTTFETYLAALSQMGAPKDLISILFLTYRFIFLFYYDLVSMQRVLGARLLPKRLSKRMLITYGQIAGSFFFKALGGAEDVYRAMKSRSFKGYIPVGRLRPLKRADKSKSLVVLLLVVLFMMVERLCFL